MPEDLLTSTRHRGTLGLSQSCRGHGIVLGPAPAASSLAHKPSGAAGSPRRSRRTRRAHFVLTPIQPALPSKAATRAPRLTQGSAPPLPARRSFRQPGGTPIFNFFHPKIKHLRNPAHVSSSDPTLTVGDGTALSSNCTFLAHVEHTNMKGFPPYL